MQATVWKRPVTACRSLAAKRGRTAASAAPAATAASYRRAASSACVTPSSSWAAAPVLDGGQLVALGHLPAARVHLAAPHTAVQTAT